MNKARIFQAELAVLVIACALSACSTSYDEAVEEWNAGRSSSPPSSTPPPSGQPPPTGFAATFSAIQANVFTPTCTASSCHGGANPAAALSLAAVDSYAQLVGIASSQVAGLQRITPANPNNSYLIQKMEGSAAVGSVMPPIGSIQQADIDTIRQWITDGAIDDRVAASSPIRVTSLSPASGGALSAAPTQIVASFDRAVDASTVNANTFILEAAGGDMTFNDGNEAQIAATSITVPGANPQAAIFDLTGVALADDSYRVRLLGLGASVLLDLDANALDGEFGGTFPSGNGSAGGDFQATFSLSTPIVIGPTLDQIQAVVFTPTCATSGCHTGPDGPVLPAGLDLSDADASLAALVGVFSRQQAATLLVAPTNPNASYLIQKLEGSAATGVRMPVGAQPLSPTVIAEIRQWITDGALR